MASNATRRLTFHGANDVVDAWSPDDRLIYISSARTDLGGHADVYAVPLSSGTPYAVSRSVTVDAERGAPSIRWILPDGLPTTPVSISPNGRWVLLTGPALGGAGLWRVEMSDRRQALSVRRLAEGSGFEAATVADDGRAYYLRNGRLYLHEAAADSSLQLPARARRSLTGAARAEALLREAWLTLRDFFADTTRTGAGWHETFEAFAPAIKRSGGVADRLAVTRLMIGELNASHVNVTGDEWREAATFEWPWTLSPDSLAAGVAQVDSIATWGWSRSSAPPRVGAHIVAVDGVPFAASLNLDSVAALGARWMETKTPTAAAASQRLSSNARWLMPRGETTLSCTPQSAR